MLIFDHFLLLFAFSENVKSIPGLIEECLPFSRRSISFFALLLFTYIAKAAFQRIKPTLKLANPVCISRAGSESKHSHESMNRRHSAQNKKLNVHLI